MMDRHYHKDRSGFSELPRDISVDEILDNCSDIKVITLKSGEVLFHEGDDAQAMYVVRKGTLRILSGNTVFETIRHGALTGEMAIIEEHAPRSATVIAVTDSELIEIDLPQVLALVAKNPRFSLTLMRVMSRRLRVMNRRHRRTTRTLLTAAAQRS